MSSEIEEVESEDPVQCQLDIEESQITNEIEDTIGTTMNDISLDIEEIHTQALPATSVVRAAFDASHLTRHSTVWLEGTSNTNSKKRLLDGTFQPTSKSNEAAWRLPSRSSADQSRPFADLPRQLTEAVTRLQSTRSMHSSLTTSAIYTAKAPRDRNPRNLSLNITGVTRSCGNVYVEATCDNGDKYIVHLPSETLPGSLLPGKRLLVDEPYTRRKHGDTWLLSLVVSVKIIE